MRPWTLSALAAAALWAAPASAQETVKIGAVLAVTGPASFLGAPEARTLEMLAEQQNAKGGIQGRRVQLLVKDTGGSPEKAISFARQLIDEEKVFAIIGPSTSGETMQIKNIAEEGKTILLSCAAAEVIVEGRYTTQPVHQAYIEPHACVVSVAADGQSQIWCSSQGHFMTRAYVSKLLGVDMSSIRVTPAASIDIQCSAYCSIVTGLPK